MNTDLKSRWVKALRSGDYPQTVGRLHRVKTSAAIPETPLGYCCIGVLCKVAALEEDDRGRFRLPYEFSDDEYTYEDCELNQLQLAEFGLTFNQQSALITMNDEEERDFDEIAAFIEDHL